MFCQQCGSQIEDGMAFCTNCGAKQVPVSNAPAGDTGVNNVQTPPAMNNTYAQPNQYAQPMNQQGAPYQGYAQPNAYATPAASESGSPKKVNFGEAIKLFFKNYANFNGRSTVSEYWWAYLFNMLVSLCVSWIPVIGQIAALGLLVPGLAISIRRLHDTGKSWVYLLMGLIPLAGPIILIVQYCKESDADNQWGPAARN